MTNKYVLSKVNKSKNNQIKMEIPLMLSLFRRLMKNADGATAIEYTLIASLIAVAAIASMRTVSGKVSNVLSNAGGAMS